MKKLRILVLVHETLVPPETLVGVPEQDAAEFRTEFDVTSCLRDMGHDVRPIGIGDSLTELRVTIQDWQPQVCFNLLEEFGGIVHEESWTPTTLFDPGLVERLSRTLGGAPLLGTGAGHDAGILASQGILASDVGVGIKTDEPNTKPKPKLTKPNFQFL